MSVTWGQRNPPPARSVVNARRRDRVGFFDKWGRTGFDGVVWGRGRMPSWVNSKTGPNKSNCEQRTRTGCLIS